MQMLEVQSALKYIPGNMKQGLRTSGVLCRPQSVRY